MDKSTPPFHARHRLDERFRGNRRLVFAQSKFQTKMVPSKKRTALPLMVTRSPRSSHHSSPPRGETWNACSFFFPSRLDQYGIRLQWDEPVTGSSGTPLAGAK